MKNPITSSELGLRERKKVRTFSLIQTNGLRLFAEKGFENTTIEEIATVSDISPGTFFRYFPTKDDVVLYDALDQPLIAAFKNQPSSLSPLQAMRNAIRVAIAGISEEERRLFQQRQELILKTPALHGKMLEELIRNIDLMAQLIAERVGLDPDDTKIRLFSGAFMGINLAAMARFINGKGQLKEYQRDFDSLLDEFEQSYPSEQLLR